MITIIMQKIKLYPAFLNVNERTILYPRKLEVKSGVPKLKLIHDFLISKSYQSLFPRVPEM